MEAVLAMTQAVYSKYFQPLNELGLQGQPLQACLDAGLLTEKEFSFLFTQFYYVPTLELFTARLNQQMEKMRRLAGL